jgi:O-antigen ligase
VVAGAALVATHTRTALLGMVVGLVISGRKPFPRSPPVRRTTVVVVLVSLATWTVFSSLIVSWLTRAQSAQELSQLTGRTKVWALVAQQPRGVTQELFGTGLGNVVLRRLGNRQ